ncbi:MAG: DUF4982 domain-containing protein [Oscillospiraceae bacterium]|nr:DUF4982 domain-containing protein [Oscillospiraceae bacterium]
MFTKPGKILFNDDWQFVKKELKTPLSEIIAEKDWYNVEMPHDWLIWDTHNLYKTNDGWYKKEFTLTAEDLTKSLELTFDGVYMDCTVYINNEAACEWKYGYTSFSFEFSHLAKEGVNTVHVQVRHECPNTRWYAGAGIYRNVWLTIQNKTHIVSDSVYIIARPDPTVWKVRVQAEISGEADFVRHTIIDSAGNEITSAEGDSSCVMEVASPKLWTLRKPCLYIMKSELIVDNSIIDTVYNRFGFRSIGFSREHGFMLNERRLKLHGVCLHHDNGALGAAYNVNASRRQLGIMKEMGVNAIRISHNPPAPEFLQLCDEMGLLVIDEFTDMWENYKTDRDYARFFPKWYKKDVASWIRRDRNHPCVVMWSIGNEISDTHHSSRGLEVAKMLYSEVQKHDPYFNAAVTIGSNYNEWEHAQSVADFLKIAGYNYSEKLYDEHYEKYPDWIIYGSETVSCVRSRGIYHMPIEQLDIVYKKDDSVMAGQFINKPRFTHEDKQCSDYGNCYPNYAKTNEEAWVCDRDRGWCGGQFIWTGMDYIGEPTPYDTKNSYFGAVDTAGLPKASYWFYRAVWNKECEPFVKIFPHWDFNDGQIIDVITYSNVHDVELFLNGRSLGKQTVDLLNDDKLHGHWKVPYEKGELVARVYDVHGNVVASDRAASFGDAVFLGVKYDEEPVYANGADLKYITVSAFDDLNEFVANARNRVSVKVSGGGRLVGFDNGDSTDRDSYKGDNRRLFSGMAVAIVQTTFEAGEVDITFSSEGLRDCRIIFDVLPCEKPVGVSVPRENVFGGYIQPYKNEIPVRKIGLSVDGKNEIKTQIYPVNASYSDIEFKCVCDDGEVTDIARVICDGNTSRIERTGTGAFRLRAQCRNGGEVVQVVSEIECTVDNG